ncbi:UDP-N-acetylglucosamine-peptide N-acetylglucosaminyltransferase [Actinoplanes sp. SE50]|uniref:tetratricopeptide repeat protein n=1 Tax=unclassified Actinoplanes TaxID=2626549 RepID=UPI00023EBD07|nr:MULTISPECIES: tetratricopeptide repeat protein [unclassified Actinoplanes]AEV83448.1 putative UDP-N-acetylglucosamine-peptide N-acetylglucosaminyltransferase SEC [Actinoplanes sp. SE50/110]ATO81841.1 UDP-N-acetylglucosamine-peptide N-acetylglucosaminyltransferase [Actinoplanes sp. SE50]SLL99249.1 UDP-N-acetylglucosamine-peptideN-acetylglucosaminyltransferase [Actinoplanes sp. SE50/110]
MRTEPLLSQADDLLDRGRAENAAHLLAPIVGRQPENVDAWHRMARAHLEMGDLDGGLRAAKAAWHFDPHGPETLYWLSRAATELGRHREAIEAAAAACREDPGNPRLHNRLADAQLAAGHVGDALDNLKIAVELADYDADLHVTFGRALFAAGRPLSARESVGRALALEPGHAAAHRTLALFEIAMEPVVDAASLAQAADGFAESLRVGPTGRVDERAVLAKDAIGYVARVALTWCLVALLVLGVLAATSLVTLPAGLYLTILCLGAVAGCGAIAFRRSLL